MTNTFEPWRIVLNRRISNANYWADRFTKDDDLESAEFWTSVHDILKAMWDEIENEENYATFTENR